MAIPPTSIPSPLRGLPLNDCWKIGAHLPSEKETHATIYLVFDNNDLPVVGLEAHAFVLDGIQPKVRKHRLRCLKRMAYRTRMEIRVRDIIVIVVSTSPATGNQAQEEHTATSDTPIAENGPKSDIILRAKTIHKQESNRIRQRERRNARRLEKAQKHFDTADREQKKKDSYDLGEETDFAAFLTLVWVLYDEDGTMRKELPILYHELVETMGSASINRLLEKYLRQISIDFQESADTEFGVKAKYRQICLLRRHLARLPSAEKYHRDKLNTVDMAQSYYQKHLGTWDKTVSVPKAQAVLELQIIFHARQALPQMLEFWESINKDSVELDEHEDKIVYSVAWPQAWTQIVFLVSHPYGTLLRKVNLESSSDRFVGL